MLAVEIGLHPCHPAWLSRMLFREEDLRAVPPEHQNVPLFRAEKSTKAQQFAVGVIGRTIVSGHICIEKPNSYAVAIASTRPSCKATQIPGNAFIRIKAKHPIELQLCACNLQQKSAMSTFCNPARLNVFLPRPIGHDQDDLRVTAENFQCPIRTRVIKCDDRVHVLADVIQGVMQNKGLIAKPRDSDQKVLLTQQPYIACDDSLAVAELPASYPRYDHCRNSK